MPRRRVAEDDDDVDFNGTQTQNQTQTQSTTLTPSEIDKKAKEVVKYLMLQDCKKVPIKRVDINKNVIKEGSRQFGTIIEKASKELKKVFGIDLVEVDKKNKVYILVSGLSEAARDSHLHSDRELEKMAILMPILGLVFMSGNSVDDDTLWHFLSKLGLNKEEFHPTFGPLDKFLKQELSKEGYLEWTKSPTPGGEQKFVIKWGPRAYKEVGKTAVLDFVCKVYSHNSEVEVTPKDWQFQYKEACEADGEAMEEEEGEEEVVEQTQSRGRGRSR